MELGLNSGDLVVVCNESTMLSFSVGKWNVGDPRIFIWSNSCNYVNILYLIDSAWFYVHDSFYLRVNISIYIYTKGTLNFMYRILRAPTVDFCVHQIYALVMVHRGQKNPYILRFSKTWSFHLRSIYIGINLP